MNNYFQLFHNINNIILPIELNWAKSNWQSFCIRFEKIIDQKNIMQYLLENGISTRRGIMCAHLEPAYSNGYWHSGGGKQDNNKLNESQKARDSSIILPLFTQLRESEQSYIVEKIIQYINS